MLSPERDSSYCTRNLKLEGPNENNPSREPSYCGWLEKGLLMRGNWPLEQARTAKRHGRLAKWRDSDAERKVGPKAHCGLHSGLRRSHTVVDHSLAWKH